MSFSHPPSRPAWCIPWVLAGVLLTGYVYFYQAGGWNQNSRFALVRAIVEQGTLRVDETAMHGGRLITGDLARYDGHLYSDKAPGLALLAVPVVAVFRLFVANPSSPAGIAALSYVATVFTAALPTVCTALLLYWLARQGGASSSASACTTLAYGLGTPAWCYATLFYGHALATACLAGSCAAAVALTDASSRRHFWRLGFAVGLCGGWATITEYPSAVPATVLSVLACAHVRRHAPTEWLPMLAVLALGASLPVTVLAAHNAAAFGSTFHLGYQSEVGFSGMAQGLLGVTYPRMHILWEVLLGRFRGLLPLAPVLAVAPVGLAAMIRVPRSRPLGLAAAVIAAFYAVFNASYHYWDGGWSYGPRHMAPALPFLCLGLPPVWAGVGRLGRAVVGSLALYGAALSLMAVATTAQPPDSYHAPLTELTWPRFVDGRLSNNWQSYLEDNLQDVRHATHAWNLGEAIGLTGLPSLAPLAVIWLVIAAFATSGLRKRRRAAGPGPP